MKLGTLEKLDLLAAAEERALETALSQALHAMRHLQGQSQVLAAYQARLTAGWRDGAVIAAAEAQRAGLFSLRAQDAALQLAASLATARERVNEAATALAMHRAKRERLRARLDQSRAQALRAALERAARNQPHRPAAPLI